MYVVDFSRLAEAACIDPDDGFQWPRMTGSITVDELRQAQANGICDSAAPYGDTWRHPVGKLRDREYHLSRILYFMRHPEEICGIKVTNPCSYDGCYSYILPGCEIIDGWHRVAAAFTLDLKACEIEYGGREDVLDYICGRTDIMPSEII
jgi:hypothetical protein